MEPKYLDKTLLVEERKADYKEKIDKMMNPFEDFNKDTFDPIQVEGMENEIFNRKRIIPTTELPTFGLKPKEIREGQMIGMYESKQDLYLIFAHRCNQLQKEIESLKEKLK